MGMFMPPQQQPQMQPQQNLSMGQRGSWSSIGDFKEVENAPVPFNGTPILFFDFQHGVFYSKKFVNGQCSIQPFGFAPLNSVAEKPAQVEPQPQPQPQIQATPTLDEATISAIFEKIDMLAQRIEKLEPKKLTRVEKGE